ncbi:hypothetical protein ACFVT5_17715 [Streptomyces sp. NPDC058001]|uniref:hypothetical protein n=1 Tax=Streptomyces sp. NPDC058001 TaxID=3346300 RepID=UPI0036ED1CDC
MSTAQHLAAIDLLCSREFPAEHGRPVDVVGAVGAVGGPGYFVVDLTGPDGHGDEGAWAYAVAEEQAYADRESLAVLLTERIGRPDHIGLQGMALRAFDTGHDTGGAIPEPWATVSSRHGDALVWRTDNRWLVLAITRRDPESPVHFLAAVTDVDPP